MSHPSQVTDRLHGTLFGLAAGDRIGGPVRMAVRLAESLAELRRFDAEDVLRRYMDWWRDDAFDTGPTAAAVFELISAGMEPAAAVRQAHEAAGGLSAGCNPAHRCAPLALAPFLDDAAIADAARSEAALTHFDPLAGEVAAATALLCRQLTLGSEWRPSLEYVASQVSDRVGQVLRHPDALPIHAGGFAVDVFHAAVHFVNRSVGFTAAIEASIQFAGHSNYCPVIVGAIAGSRFGVSTIPTSLLRHCTILSRIESAAIQLSGPSVPVA